MPPNTNLDITPALKVTLLPMLPSLRCCSARAHTPLIKFLGRRSWPSTLNTPHPHPAAPAELKQKFAEFLKKVDRSSTDISIGPNVYKEFWESPSRFWQPKVRQLTDAEMESVMSGGASSY